MAWLLLRSERTVVEINFEQIEKEAGNVNYVLRGDTDNADDVISVNGVVNVGSGSEITMKGMR